MADKTEFLQAMNEALLDADSLELFINGDDTQDVLTRLTVKYPTLQKALKEMFENGGLPATPFATKALMTASSLPNGSYAIVTDGSIDSVGLWLKNEGQWIKSKYDVLNYADNIFAKKVFDSGELSYSVIEGALTNNDAISMNDAAFVSNSQGRMIKVRVSGVSSLRISGASESNPKSVWVFAASDDNKKLNDGSFYGNGILKVPEGAKWAYRNLSYKEWSENEGAKIEYLNEVSSEAAFKKIDILNKTAVRTIEETVVHKPYVIKGANINTDEGNPKIRVTEAGMTYVKINIQGVSKLRITNAKTDKASIKWVFADNDANVWTSIAPTSGNGDIEVPEGAKWAYRSWGSPTWQENTNVVIELVYNYPQDSFGSVVKGKETGLQRAQRIIRDSGMPVVKVSDFEGSTSHDKIETAIEYIKAQNGGILDLESGVHLRNSAILLPSNCWLYLNDSVLRLADGVHDNLIRNDGIIPDPDPYGINAELNENHNIRIFGNGTQRSGIYGPSTPYTAPHPIKGGDPIEWVGDDWGWRTLEINLINVKNYNIHDFRMYGNRCWGITQQHGCEDFKIHDIEFFSNVPNGDGIDILMGCKNAEVYNITGWTQDDTVALSGMEGFLDVNPTGNYIFPMHQGGWRDRGFGTKIENVVIKNIEASGAHSGIRLLTGGTSVISNVRISNMKDTEAGYGTQLLLVGSGWGVPSKMGAINNVYVNNLTSIASPVVMRLTYYLQDCWFNNITQLNPLGVVRAGETDDENVRYTNISP